MNYGHRRTPIPKYGVRKTVAKTGPSVLRAGRRERRAAETRVRLFRSALKLISKRGLADVTVEDITEAADVGKGTFFNYFASKEHVLGVMAEIQLGKVREAAALAERGTHTVHSVMRRLMRGLAEEPGRSPRLARALISTFLASDEVRAILKRNLHAGRKTIGRVIAAGQGRGEIDPKLNPERVAMQCFQTVIGTVLLWSLHEKPKLTAWMEKSFEAFWRSVAATGKSRRYEARNR